MVAVTQDITSQSKDVIQLQGAIDTTVFNLHNNHNITRIVSVVNCVNLLLIWHNLETPNANKSKELV